VEILFVIVGVVFVAFVAMRFLAGVTPSKLGQHAKAVGFRAQHGTLGNFTLVAKNITYCCEAVREAVSGQEEPLYWLWGAGMATQQYRFAGQITEEQLLRVLEVHEVNFVDFVTELIILELAADAPDLPRHEVAAATRAKRAAIARAIDQARAEFPTSNTDLAQSARMGAMLFAGMGESGDG